MKLEIVSKSRPTSDSVSLYFKKPKELDKYKPGQHALLSFRINEQLFKRTYSFHTLYEMDEHLGITVRAVEGGIVSNYLQNVNGNSEIHLDGISGDFTLQSAPDIRRHVIMFAGGSGITPIYSMLKEALHNEPMSTISLIYSNKIHSRIIFKDELSTFEKKFPERLKIFHILTQEENVTSEVPVFCRGRLSKLITKKLLKSILAENNSGVEYYLCGPYPFMQLIEETIRGLMPDETKIFKEHYFIPEQTSGFDYTTLPQREVIIQTQDEEKLLIVPSGKSILQAALENKITLPYSCTEGQCGRCRACLVSGEVKLRKNHILTEEELKEGQILLCQGFPISEGVTIKTSL